ncbi:hypothetical protein NA56DRAFT_576918, partial [Hyaloscypha hepaticicola]
PLILLKLHYRNITINLFRDPNSGFYQILIEFTYKFTKKYLETRNIFPFPEIIFNPSLILNPHINLLDLVFTNNTFLAPSLISAVQISELDILSGYK